VNGGSHPPAAEGVRLDQWLWAARMFKTRSLARQAVEAGRVRVDGQGTKPSRLLRGGEWLDIERAAEPWRLQVVGLSDQRGPAATAQRMYHDDPEVRARRERLRAERAAARAGYQPPASRPDKRARRLLRALGDYDAG
jgi:ribosome-associated heat shock protein Hsp15